MFGLFKKTTEKQKLQKQYENLLAEAHRLSSINRKLSDEKIAESEELLAIMNKLKP